MSTKLVLWYCSMNHRNDGPTGVCRICGCRRNEIAAVPRENQRSVAYYNQQTGEYRHPARADQPMPEIYARQGFERKEITSMVQHERATGLIHEDSNWASNGLAESSLTAHLAPPKITGLDEPFPSE